MIKLLGVSQHTGGKVLYKLQLVYVVRKRSRPGCRAMKKFTKKTRQFRMVVSTDLENKRLTLLVWHRIEIRDKVRVSTCSLKERFESNIVPRSLTEDTGINRPFPSSLVPLFQSESKCETILMKMSLICRKMKLHVELIFIRMVSHLDSL